MTIEDMSWASKAICKGKTSLFFVPGTRESTSDKRKRELIAMTYCQQCPVISECRDHGRRHNELGIWGGENEEMRWKAGFLRVRNYRPRRALRHQTQPSSAVADNAKG